MNILRALAAADATSANQTNRLPQRPDPRLMSREDYANSIPWYSRLVGEMVGQPHDLPNDNIARIEGPDGNFFTGEMMRAEVPDSPGDLRNMMRALGRMPERTNPAYVASKKWFHGTATEGLSPKELNPFATKAEGLFGQGIYLTDDSFEVPSGYAKARSRFMPGTPLEAGKKQGLIYEARVAPRKVLDLEAPAPEEVKEVFRKRMTPVQEPPYMGFEREPYVDIEDPIELSAALKKKDVTTEELYTALKNDLQNSGDARIDLDGYYVVMDNVSYGIQESGYDALTHTGGGRTGGKEHQVLIMLDPNAENQLNPGNQITQFSPVRKPTKNTPRKTEWPMFRR